MYTYLFMSIYYLLNMYVGNLQFTLLRINHVCYEDILLTKLITFSTIKT